jgi:hypothetical protein
VILPVVLEITMVAEVRRPEMTARDEATTAIEGMLADAIVENSCFFFSVLAECSSSGENKRGIEGSLETIRKAGEDKPAQ